MVDGVVVGDGLGDRSLWISGQFSRSVHANNAVRGGARVRPEHGDVGLDVRDDGFDVREAVHDERGLRVVGSDRDVRDRLRGQQALRAIVSAVMERGSVR